MSIEPLEVRMARVEERLVYVHQDTTKILKAMEPMNKDVGELKTQRAVDRSNRKWLVGIAALAGGFIGHVSDWISNLFHHV